MEREISPPPTKRRRQDERDKGEGFSQLEVTSPSGMRYIRIFTWNVNGVHSFLPSSTTPITSFFKPVPRQLKRATDGEPPDKTSGPRKAPLVGSPLRAFLSRHDWPEVLFLQELKINRQDQKTPTALLSALNTPLGSNDQGTAGSRYTLDVNLPRDKFNARGFGGKLYGVGTILREDFASQHVATVRHAEWDLEGRVSIVELQRPSDGCLERDTESDEHRERDQLRTLALINVYAVNGTSAPYRSSENGQTVGTRHELKISFHSKLRDECLQLEKRGFDVVVAGDLNVARGQLDGHPNLRTWPKQHCVNRADFNTKLFGKDDNRRADAYVGGDDVKSGEISFQGVDVFRALRGKERKYTYHPRGDDEWGSSCDRVDLIIASKSVYENGGIDDTGILDSPQERGTSDHVPLWVKVKLGGSDEPGVKRRS
ncbi:hypothetical protein INS49_001812 [Diaporthe citri]|uniref:uncharacterized protein n=1 Tax=Diaporthe citri TaxID=83186 RepID=UPI001C7F9EEE|nr:uncharacterized protein INS49_001812 [Diaporthe citri]KAG6367619.1 hypothetical protein INS49_001812 [Diaporthe citri]